MSLSKTPLQLFSVLYGFGPRITWRSTEDVMREFAAQYLALAEKQGAIVPLMIGHRLMGSSLTWTGDIAEGRAHYDKAIGLDDPVQHHRLATRSAQTARVATMSFRSLALWMLGYPEAALAELETGAQRCTRNRPNCQFAVRAIPCINYLHPL